MEMKSKLGGGIMSFLSFAIVLFGLAYAEELKPITGHSVTVDKNIGDWVGTPPLEDNASVVSAGEFIFKDANLDDTGDGDYQYPTNEVFKRCADLREFRVTFDKDNLYFLIRFNKPGQSWVPYCLIGIDKDGTSGGIGGTVILAEGDLDFISEDTGTYAELKVAPELAVEYVVGIFSCYRGRIWDAEGKMVARRDGKEGDTPGFLVDDVNWSSVEVAIPQSIIGNPAGETWRFIVATGLEEYSHLREMGKTATEWHGGGGIGTGDEGEVDPDVYDLASPNQEIQQKELSSYNPEGEWGKEEAFATIRESYLSVSFSGTSSTGSSSDVTW